VGGSCLYKKIIIYALLGLTMVTRDNFLVIGPHPQPPPPPQPPIFVDLSAVLVVCWLFSDYTAHVQGNEFGRRFELLCILQMGTVW
jgi:hypothetical protein